jgi:hypothetical protein
MAKRTKNTMKTRARSSVKPRAPRTSSTQGPASKRRRLSTPQSCTDVPAATNRFVNDLLIRGEADKIDKKGKLPLRATHAIKQNKSDGSLEVERVRFKTW